MLVWIVNCCRKKKNSIQSLLNHIFFPFGSFRLMLVSQPYRCAAFQIHSFCFNNISNWCDTKRLWRMQHVFRTFQGNYNHIIFSNIKSIFHAKRFTLDQHCCPMPRNKRIWMKWMNQWERVHRWNCDALWLLKELLCHTVYRVHRIVLQVIWFNWANVYICC